MRQIKSPVHDQTAMYRGHEEQIVHNLLRNAVLLYAGIFVKHQVLDFLAQ